MKRLALCVVLVLMSWGPGTQARQGAFDCIQTNRCQSPPPCEFMTELKHAKATERARAQLVVAAATMSATAFIEFDNQLNEDVSKRIKAYSADCQPWDVQRKEWIRMSMPPILVGCLIGMKDANGKFVAADLEDFKKVRNTCSEIAAADDRELFAKASACERARLAGNDPSSEVEFQVSRLQTIHSKVNSLQSSLLRYLSSCVPDANLATQLSALGLDALMADGKAARDEWLAEQAKSAR